jgi:hypothetical protein
MGIKQSEMSEFRGIKESLIETRYIGSNNKLKGMGEAYLDVPNNQWKYRPYKSTVTFHDVEASEIECASDKGWVKGNYIGLKVIGKLGKASWNEVEDCWVYKPKGQQRTYLIPEGEFQMVRDVDVLDK